MLREHSGYLDLGHGVGAVNFYVRKERYWWVMLINYNDNIHTVTGTRQYVMGKLRRACRRD